MCSLWLLDPDHLLLDPELLIDPLAPLRVHLTMASVLRGHLHVVHLVLPLEGLNLQVDVEP